MHTCLSNNMTKNYILLCVINHMNSRKFSFCLQEEGIDCRRYVLTEVCNDNSCAIGNFFMLGA